MNASQRKWVWRSVALSVTAIGSVVWSYSYFDEQRSAASNELQDLASCEEIAGRLALAQGSVKISGAESRAAVDLTRRIAQAANAAGLPADSVEGIRPDSMRRSASGKFLEKPTQLVVHHVTLQQIINLLTTLDQHSEGLRVEKMHFSGENDPRRSNEWTVEAIFVCTVPDDTKSRPLPGS